MRVLGIDPGKHNGWWCVFRTTLVSKLVLLDSDQIDMSPDASVMERIDHLYYEAKRVLNRTSPNWVFAERFITRPRGSRGNVSEPVNHFLGLLYSEAKRRRIKSFYVMPSVHKVWRRNQYYSDEDFRAQWPTLNEHQIDACSIAHHGWVHYC